MLLLVTTSGVSEIIFLLVVLPPREHRCPPEIVEHVESDLMRGGVTRYPCSVLRGPLVLQCLVVGGLIFCFSLNTVAVLLVAAFWLGLSRLRRFGLVSCRAPD